MDRWDNEFGVRHARAFPAKKNAAPAKTPPAPKRGPAAYSREEAFMAALGDAPDRFEEGLGVRHTRVVVVARPVA